MGAYCGTLVFAAVGEPDILLPPSTQQVAARDIEEQLFLKLADIGLTTNTIGDEDFQPLLAERWEWDGPLTLVFHLDTRARWQDGQPVTASDVAFTFDAYTDSAVASPYRANLRRVASVKARDPQTAVFRFRERYPEMFYDAVYHMRVLPAHLLRGVPRDQWKTAPFGRQPVGDGPYRFRRVARRPDHRARRRLDVFPGPPGDPTPDLALQPRSPGGGHSGGGRSGGRARGALLRRRTSRAFRAAPQVTLYPYRGNAYGYLGFNLAANGDTTQPHPIFGDRVVTPRPDDGGGSGAPHQERVR